MGKAPSHPEAPFSNLVDGEPKSHLLSEGALFLLRCTCGQTGTVGDEEMYVPKPCLPARMEESSGGSGPFCQDRGGLRAGPGHQRLCWDEELWPGC